jgi:putative chitobiose transport system substrate-binding protein
MQRRFPIQLRRTHLGVRRALQGLRSGPAGVVRVLGGVSLVLLLACGGCGRGTAPAAAPRPRQLTVWTLDLAPRFSPYMGRVIAAWERAHPGVSVRWIDVPWSSVERKLLAAVFARTAPDLVNLNPPFAANLASKGGLLNLATVLPPEAAALYLPEVWQAGRQGDLQFAIPWYLTTRVTLANRKLLQQAGYTAPPRRWDQIPAYAEAIKRRTGRYALFVTVVPDDSAELLETLVQMEVRLLDANQRAAFNSAAGRRAFAFWTDLYRRGLLPPEVVSQGYRRAIELYQAGDLAQVASGPDFLRNLQTNAPGIAALTAPFPPLVGPGGQTNVAVMNLVVPRQSSMAPEATSFALFLTNASNQLDFAREARVLPSSRAALKGLEQDLAVAGVGPAAERQEALVRQARALSVRNLDQARVLVPATPGIKRLQAILYTQLQRAMLGQIGSDAALAEAERQWNRYAEARWP